MSTPQSLTSQLADALIAGDQDAVISIMAQVIAYIADDESVEDDAPLTKAARDGRPSTPLTSQLIPYSDLKTYASEHVVRRVDPANFTTVIRKELAPGVTALIGDGKVVESIRFDATKFSKAEANAWIAKMGPGVNSVHVDTAGDSVSDTVCDMCGKSPCECIDDKFIITKAGEEKRLAYGIVMRPAPFVDSQGDTCTIEEIEKMAHGFMMRPGDNQNFDLNHILDVEPGRVYCVESYISPVDTILDNGKRIEKGAWVVVTKFVDDGLWQLAKSGAIGAYSIRGYGTRIPQTSQ